MLAAGEPRYRRSRKTYDAHEGVFCVQKTKPQEKSAAAERKRSAAAGFLYARGMPAGKQEKKEET